MAKGSRFVRIFFVVVVAAFIVKIGGIGARAVDVTRYRTVARSAVAETEVKRSRFLCRVERVESEEAARAVVDRARKEHWDARHHCSAFVLGPDGAVQRSSDDGEPSGTAGAPMLEVLRGREVSDVVAVVTRWFGGTLLGAGGLVRAYGDAVRAGLDAAGVRRTRAGGTVRRGRLARRGRPPGE